MPTIPHSIITLTFPPNYNGGVPLYVSRDSVGAVFTSSNQTYVNVFGHEYPVTQTVDEVLAAL